MCPDLTSALDTSGLVEVYASCQHSPSVLQDERGEALTECIPDR